jgi:hypothetical protein
MMTGFGSLARLQSGPAKGFRRCRLALLFPEQLSLAEQLTEILAALWDSL